VTTGGPLSLVATCSLGLEELLAGELHDLGVGAPQIQRGAVAFTGGWPDCWRANWRLRTANRVLVELATWEAHDGAALAAGARALSAGTTEGSRLSMATGAAGTFATSGTSQTAEAAATAGALTAPQR